MFMALGFGRSLPFWRDVAFLQHQRLQELEARLPAVRDHFTANVAVYAANNPVMNQWNLEVQADAHFLLVSIRHVLRLGERLQNLTRASDTRAGALRRTFLSKYRDAERLRGILEHFDEYSVGGKTDPERGVGPDLYGFHVDHDGEHVLLVMGKRRIALVPLGQAAVELALGLDALWQELVFQQPATQDTAG
jgi:hypothetical protein